MTNPGQRCNGCKYPAPGAREVYVSTGAATVLVGRYGRRCYRRVITSLRAAGQVPLHADGRPVRYGAVR